MFCLLADIFLLGFVLFFSFVFVLWGEFFIIIIFRERLEGRSQTMSTNTRVDFGSLTVWSVALFRPEGRVRR